MPSVLDRSALEQSPLADLHLLANELGVDGFRRLRKPDLVDAILTRQSGEEVVAPSRGRGRGRGRGRSAAAAVAVRGRRRPKRSRRGRRGGRGRRREEEEGDGDARRSRRAPRRRRRSAPRRRRGALVEGAVELLANGSGFLRLSPAERDRRRRLHLRRAGQALRARLRRPRRRPGARRAPLRALPVADPRRHDQRPPGRGGRRGHALRGPAGGVAVRAHRSSAPRTRRSRRSSG